jgi:hypothetical protein
VFKNVHLAWAILLCPVGKRSGIMLSTATMLPSVKMSLVHEWDLHFILLQTVLETLPVCISSRERLHFFKDRSIFLTLTIIVSFMPRQLKNTGNIIGSDYEYCYHQLGNNN